MPREDIEKRLFLAAHDKYGDKYTEHLLEQYKIYIDSAEKISDRRQKANEFFLGLNSALVALLGFMATKTDQGEATLVLSLAACAGMVICYLWYRIILSYKGLNGGKFEVIHAIEARLPLSLYDTEWEVLGRGENKEIYWPFTHIELWVPRIFMGIYLVLLLSFIPWNEIARCLYLSFY